VLPLKILRVLLYLYILFISSFYAKILKQITNLNRIFFMSKDDTVLKIISNETKSSIDQMPIVTPSIYASLFAKFATDHHENIEEEEGFSVDLIKQECSTLTAMQTQTSKNANQLSNTTAKAINAIKEKDEKALAAVLKETQKLRREIEHLKEAVYKDELTRAYNRKWMKEHYLNEEADIFAQSGTLIMIDLNYFKEVNDTHGHIIGDKVLVYISNELKKITHNVIRYGGDEFIIIFPDKTSFKSDITTIESAREHIISKKLKANEHKFIVSFSYGGVEFKSGDDLGDTIALADKKMYDDKIQIKKRVTSI
jgi:diguanylate cyclase (GGDEF)-like protein